MNKDHDYTIQSGDFARICGTTRDTLRYYEKQQLLIPWKDPENGYHYYSYAQIGSFYFISTFRIAGSPTREIRDYLLNANQAGFIPQMGIQIEELKRQRADLDRKIRQLSGVVALDSVFHAHEYGVPTITDCPEGIVFLMAPVASGNAYSLSDIAQDIQHHVHLFPDMAGAFPAGTAMDAADFLNEDYRYIKVISLRQADSSGTVPAEEAFPESIAAWKSVTAFTLPSRRIAAIACRETDGDIKDIYRRFAAFIVEKNLKLLTDVFSLSLVNLVGPDQKRRYLKYIFVSIAD
ncbi:MAG: MerR family transcriptional regulator [Eubacterium sp.]|nr:MerR family transcriptional regulator [Eubacterium sp.]